ncbi:MAG: hypothetical protein IPK55_13855 [Streptococcus sp.]|nr:hypothetical protein [Streptococcus sp.]
MTIKDVQMHLFSTPVLINHAFDQLILTYKQKYTENQVMTFHKMSYDFDYLLKPDTIQLLF